VNQEAKIAQAKPVLTAESFQCLLAAAYIMQVHNDRRPSVQPIGAAHTSPFAARAIIQQLTPAVMIREPRLQADQPDTVPGDEIATEPPHPGRLPAAEPTVRRMNILPKKAMSMSWRTVDALAVAIVFCMMMGLSIHSLSALPGNMSPSSGVMEQRNISQPARLTPRISATDRQSLVTQHSRQSRADGEGNIVAEDTIIHYQNRAASFPGQAADKPTISPMQAQLLPPKNTTSTPRVRSTLGRDAGTLAVGTVVQYGVDVTMWSRIPERDASARVTR
jgi:hypothetical protein